MQEVSRDDLRPDEPTRKKPAPAGGRVADAIAAEERVRATYLIGGAALVAFVFLYLQFRTQALIDVDAYYHIKWSRLLWDNLLRGSFPAAFPYLPLTTLNPRDYVDHHLLFHMLLIPFTWLGDLRVGAKAAAVVCGSLGVLSCYWLILRYRVRYAPVWLLALLASSAPFLYRMSMTRAQTLSIVFLIVGIYLLFEARYRWLALVAFLYVWYYSLFVLLGAAALAWTVSLLISERRLEWRPLVWTGVGTAAGFLVNPYFPKNIVLFVSHVLMKVKADQFSTSVGAEWYPYDSWYFVGSSAVAFVSMVIGYLVFNWENRHRSARAMFFMMFATLLLVANARSRRFVEYWPPFAVLFAAFALQTFWERGRAFVSRLPTELMDDLQPFLDRGATVEEASAPLPPPEQNWEESEPLLAGVMLGGLLLLTLVTFYVHPIANGALALIVGVPAIVLYYRQRGRRVTATALVVCALLIPLFFGVRETGNTIASEQGPNEYRGGAEWLRSNAPAGQMIFNTDWDDFPKLFFYDSTHNYASGLDPTYLLEADPELSKLYESITLGKEDNSAELIRDRFGARYVFTDNEEIHQEVQEKLIESGWFEIAYHDDWCTVLQLLDERRATPAGIEQQQDEARPAEEGDDRGAEGDEQNVGGREEESVD